MSTDKQAASIKKKTTDRSEFTFSKENYKWLLIGLSVVTIGFLLMIGGGSDDPDIFIEKEIFSFRRITLAPIVVLSGYAVVMVAIMKRFGK